MSLILYFGRLPAPQDRRSKPGSNSASPAMIDYDVQHAIAARAAQNAAHLHAVMLSGPVARRSRTRIPAWQAPAEARSAAGTQAGAQRRGKVREAPIIESPDGIPATGKSEAIAVNFRKSSIGSFRPSIARARISMPDSALPAGAALATGAGSW